ncbi:class I SAM-dependent methyltransferase [Propionivibrio soli]|uniref:class I SAM-dependent methyltransferase n=1 Tax=Propionivibrio soli TaxID=2976531 RepID=UPI0021E79A22|nr:class I SAM-dependent methyltransferase [Propionivibrio soli]
MSRFGSDPLSFFETVYREKAPWDMAGPQPAMVSLLAEYPPDGPVLDLGCGTGDLAIHLATSGVETIGVDFVELAVNQAQAKKAALPPEVASRLDFHVADALHPSLLRKTFGAVVDSGFFHLFDPEQCETLLDELPKVFRQGGRYYLHEFAVTFPVPNVPRQVTEAELRDRFTVDQGWRILTVRSGEFLSRVASVPATLACVEYLGMPE